LLSNLSGAVHPIFIQDLEGSKTALHAQRSNTQLLGKNFSGLDGNYSSLSTKKGVTFGALSTLDSRNALNQNNLSATNDSTKHLSQNYLTINT
jgi:hypothetical protein